MAQEAWLHQLESYYDKIGTSGQYSKIPVSYPAVSVALSDLIYCLMCSAGHDKDKQASDWEYFFSLLYGMLVHDGVSPIVKLSDTHFCT